MVGCFEGGHDYWAAKINTDLTDDANFTGQCVSANIGGSYGGTMNDHGQSVVPVCGAYLLAGFTKSNNNVESCTLPACEVTCNHYDCNESASEDIWLAKINSTTGAYISNWNESIGQTGNDRAYSIKRFYDGSYVIAGYTTNNGEHDIYVKRFELADACAAPVLQSPIVAGNCASVSWTMENCVWKYILHYEEGGIGGSSGTIDPASSPYKIIDNTAGGDGNFTWYVTAYCSPNKYTTTTGNSFSLTYCNGCACPLKLGDEDFDAMIVINTLSVYPNPTVGNFKISLTTSQEDNQKATIDILD